MKLKDLKPADIGRNVVFRYPHGETDEGVITSWNELYVFVRFGKNGSQACYPSMLEWSSPSWSR